MIRKHWSFVTGQLIDITALPAIRSACGSRAIPTRRHRPHTCRTVVVDAQGRIQKIYHNNDWTADDLVAEILKAAQAKP